MRPLVFEFMEDAVENTTEALQIGYDNALNLNIDILTGKPAIEAIDMSTRTNTKDQIEGSDSDKNGLNILMQTATGSYDGIEVTDIDQDRSFNQIVMSTMTLTRTQMEGTDSDR